MSDGLTDDSRREREAEAARRVRTPEMMHTMAYGAPSVPYEPREWYPPAQPYMPQVEVAPPGKPYDWSKLLDAMKEPVPEQKKRSLRVSTMLETTGALKLKVYLDGVLLYEAISEHGTTLTLETLV